MSVARAAHQLAMQVSPIILTGGTASLIPGGMLPIIAIMQAANFVSGLLGGSVDLNLDNAFANFEPMAGGSLIANEYGTYPFANQSVAANAVIQQPLNISMKMTVPARAPGGFAAKLATMEALKATLKTHINQGGTFTVVTPASIYTNCLLLNLRDVGVGQASQPQAIYMWDFFAPLLTEDQAIVAMNNMMGKLSAGLPSTGALSGAEVVGGFPQSLAGPALSPSMSNLTGSGVAGFSGFGGG